MCPSFSFTSEMDENAYGQIKHECILSLFYDYAKANKITFEIDLTSLAYPLDKEGLLNITDPIVKKARQTLIDANFSVFLDHIQKYIQ